MDERLISLIDHFYDRAKEAIVDGSFRPLAILISAEWELEIIPFEANTNEEKSIFTHVVQSLAQIRGSQAIIMCIEAWMLGVETRDPKMTSEEIHEVYEDLLERYGGDMKNVPGRAEILNIAGTDKYGDRYQRIGQIIREGDNITFRERDADYKKETGKFIFEGWAKKPYTKEDKDGQTDSTKW